MRFGVERTAERIETAERNLDRLGGNGIFPHRWGMSSHSVGEGPSGLCWKAEQLLSGAPSICIKLFEFQISVFQFSDPFAIPGIT